MGNLTQVKNMFNRIVIRYKYYNKKRNWKIWVFGEWFGEKCNDSSLSLANYVAENFNDIIPVWIACKNCIGLEALNSKVRILEKGSKESIDLLKKAGVFFVNEGLQDISEHGYNYSSGGIIVNLWHGIPWKKIGMDSYRKTQILKKLYARVIFKMQTFTFFPTSSDKCSQSLMSGFMIKNKKHLIKSGLPRNEIFLKKELVDGTRNKIIKLLKYKNDKIDDNTRIITYMPTFRDNNSNNFDFTTINKIDELSEFLEKNNTVIIQKAHIISQGRDKQNNKQTSRILSWNDCSAQELMAASDILITDYSSCFFDYLLLDRPIIHYLYDYDYYINDDRGLYYKKEEVVCGDVVSSENDLLSIIQENFFKPNKNHVLRGKRRAEYLTYEGDNSCEKIIRAIIKEIKRRRKNIEGE